MATETLTAGSWRDRLNESFLSLEVEVPDRNSDFGVSVRGGVAGDVKAAIIEVEARPHIVRRSSTHVNRDRGEYLLMSTQLDGSMLVRQDNREAMIGPMDLVIYDSRRPYELVFPSGSHRQAVMQVPLDLVQSSSLTSVTATRVSGSGGVGAALSPMIAAIPDALTGCDPDHVGVMINMVRDSVEYVRQSLPVCLSRHEQLFDEALRFMRVHHANPDLGPAHVASALHISLSHLHRVFSRHDQSVRASLQDIRLSKAATDLRDPRYRDATVVDISSRHGFKTPAHFSRAFSRRFGSTPLSFREDPETLMT